MTRLLFLHGMFCPPKSVVCRNCPLFASLEDAGFEITTVQSPRTHSGPVPPVVFEIFPDLKSQESSLPEWYNAHDNDKNGTKRLDGLQDSLSFLKKFIADQPPFDVIAGHSQGGQLAAILTLLMEDDDTFLLTGKMWKATLHMNSPNPFSNVETVGLHQKVATHGKIKTPSVHVLGGSSDHTLEGSRAMLAEHYSDENVIVVHHDEGHFLPKDDRTCKQIATALQQVLQNHI